VKKSFFLLPSRLREGLTLSRSETRPPITQNEVNSAPRCSGHAGGMADLALASGRGN
jgi:hypothetical protein